jgi:hypothetical protein
MEIVIIPLIRSPSVVLLHQRDINKLIKYDGEILDNPDINKVTVFSSPGSSTSSHPRSQINFVDCVEQSLNFNECWNRLLNTIIDETGAETIEITEFPADIFFTGPYPEWSCELEQNGKFKEVFRKCFKANDPKLVDYI